MTASISRRTALTAAVVGILVVSALGITLAVSSGPDLFSSPTRAPSHTTGATPVPTNFTWTNVTSLVGAPPSCRDSEGLVFDAELNKVVLFGGVSQCGQTNSWSQGDTWTYSGGSWTNISSTLSIAPSPRWGMAMVYDPASQQIVLFGGTDTYGNVNDQTWVFNGTWSQVALNATSPPALYGAGATYDPSLGGVLLYGGQAGFSGGPGTIYNATWLFKGGVWTQLNVVGPDPLRSSTLVYDAAINASILFGGFDQTTGAPSGLTWSFANGTWTQLTPSTSPPARFAAGATYDPQTGVVVLFGGFTSEFGNYNSPLSDTWTFVNGTWVNVTSPYGNGPSPRAGDRLVWDGADGYGIEFGGQSNGVRDIDTWTFT